MTVVICEDESYFAARLQELVNQYLQQNGRCAAVWTCDSGEALLRSGQMPDVLLMDIRLSGENGMETMRRLRAAGCDSPVIFITAYPEYVFQAFDVDAVQYLIKPLERQKFFAAMDKAWNRAASDGGPTILLTNGAAVTKVRIKDIVYCEVFDHQTMLHTMTHPYRYAGTLDSLEQRLDRRFFRCHRSYLVNLDYVVGKEPGRALLADGGRVYVARRKQQEFTMRLLEWCRKGE